MTKWRKKAPVGKETSTQMEKKHKRLGGNSSLQNSTARASVGNPQIREIRRATAVPACLLTEPGANPERQADKKKINLTLRKRILQHLGRCPAQEDIF